MTAPSLTSSAEMAFAQADRSPTPSSTRGSPLPYRSSSPKNQVRFQFGGRRPKACCDAGAGESWAAQVEAIAMSDPAT